MDPRIIEIYSHRGQIPQPDPRHASDLVMTEMARLSDLPPVQRNLALEPYVYSWIEMRTDPLIVAYYLSAAGMTLDEAVALEEGVLSRMCGPLRQQARRDVSAGLATMVMALLMFGATMIWEDRSSTLWRLVLILLLSAGLVMLVRGITTLRRITPPPEDEISRP